MWSVRRSTSGRGRITSLRQTDSKSSAIADLGARLGVEITDVDLMGVALTHRSFASEFQVADNERIEFLGDAVLDLGVRELSFQWFPELSEGDLSSIRMAVCNSTVLGETSRSLGIGEFMNLGKGEEASGGRNKISLLADTLEAVIGAIYVQSGWPVAKDLVERVFGGRIRETVKSGLVVDFKTALQGAVQSSRAGERPVYTTSAHGPHHARRFSATVTIGGRTFGQGEGSSKKAAEQAAAAAAIEEWGDNDS